MQPTTPAVNISDCIDEAPISRLQIPAMVLRGLVAQIASERLLAKAAEQRPLREENNGYQRKVQRGFDG